MPTPLGSLALKEAAIEAAGNWSLLESYGWPRGEEIADAENWALIYTHHRDSDLLEQSNAALIAKALAPFSEEVEPDIIFEFHPHWAVGHMNGFSVRVFKDGRITDAFCTYHELAVRLESQGILTMSM